MSEADSVTLSIDTQQAATLQAQTSDVASLAVNSQQALTLTLSLEP